MTTLTYVDTVSTYIRQALESEVSVREAFHIHGHSYRGLFQSSKGLNGNSIPFESGLARDALRLFELAPEVSTIISEPATIRFLLNGKQTSYRPDYLLRLRDGRRAFVEIKYAKEARNPANQVRYKEIGTLIEQADGMFAVLTEEHLRTHVLLQNLPLLERHCHVSVSISARTWLEQCIASTEHLTLADAANTIGRATALAAIAQGLVTTDFRQHLITNRSLLKGI